MGACCQGERKKEQYNFEEKLYNWQGQAIETPEDLENRFDCKICNLEPNSPNVAEKRAALGTFKYDSGFDLSYLIIVSKETSVPGEIYYGFWHSINKTREYKGIILYSEGGIFEGHFATGKKMGQGRLILPSLDYYVGNWVDDELHGEGKYVRKNGDSYDGEWHQGKPEGRGQEKFFNGERYEGNFTNGKKNGVGHWSGEGEEYFGDFVDGKRQGTGSYIWKNKRCYNGHWKNDMESGEGEMSYPDGSKYQGQFLNGKRHGLGTFTWNNGGTLEGNWENNIGRGKFLLTLPNTAPVETFLDNLKKMPTVHSSPKTENEQFISSTSTKKKV